MHGNRDEDRAARPVAEGAEIMRLRHEDQVRFAEAMLKPAQANERLARAAARHAELIEHAERI